MTSEENTETAALIDAAIDRQGYVRTRQGYMREHHLKTPYTVRRGVF